MSRRVVSALLSGARRDADEARRLAEHSGISQDELLHGRGPIDWVVFRRLLESVRALWGPSTIHAAGEALVARRSVSALSPLTRRVVGPLDLYGFLAHPRVGRFHELFPGVRCRAWELTPEQIAFELELDERDEPFPELIQLVRGMLAGAPAALGLPPAEVSAEPGRRGALFHVRSPGHDTVVARARRAVRTVRRLRVAVDELQAAHTLLNRQYDDLRVAERALRESEERFRALIENSSDFILLTDATGRVTYLSPSAHRITGFSPDELSGRFHVDLAHDEDRRTLERALADLTKKPGSQTTLRFRFLTRCDKWIWLEGTAKNMLDDPRGPAVLVNYRDVTDRVLLEEQLLQSRKLESMGRLAGGIAHDFNNLLTGIVGNAQLLLNKLDGQDPKRDSVHQIIEYARRASDLTGQLLSFARRQVVKPKRINLNTTILETRSLLDRLIGDQVKIVTMLDPELGTVRIDPSQLQQLIINLAINARDAMQGGGVLTIRTENAVSQDHEAPAVVLSVTDTGAGMDEETLTKIFDPFFTTKELGRGTGLGLATCHGIVSQVGGRIDVQSRIGGGTTFRVSLPRVGGPAETSEIEEAARAPRGTEMVLLVEDEEAVRRSTAELLRGLGYRVLTAAHGAHALALLNSNDVRPDAVVTDVVMPRLTGVQLVERLRQIHPAIRVVYISGYADQAVPSGAPLVRKPFEIAELAHRLREVLDARPRSELSVGPDSRP